MRIYSCLLVAGMALSLSSTVHAIDIPEPTVDQIEASVGDVVSAAVDGRVSGTAGPLDNWEWRVDFLAEVAFSQAPTVTCDGMPCEAVFVGLSKGFTLEAYMPLEVTLDADAKIHHDTFPDSDAEAHVQKTVGALVRVPIERTSLLGFELKAEEAEVALTDEGGNVNVNGLTGDFVRIGSLTGGLTFGVIGFGAGALVGFIGANEAEDAIQSEIKKAFKKQLEKASEELSVRVRDALGDRRDEVAGTLTALVLAVR